MKHFPYDVAGVAALLIALRVDIIYHETHPVVATVLVAVAILLGFWGLRHRSDK
jgi:hypothetical protein